jgi:redox-sensitive bicupin YhaK (pirin superfamily)
MLRIRKSQDRGHRSTDWLQSWFTFSFDQYRDPAHIHWNSLRVINEDIIAPGMGFGMHPHHDMEIISFVISGALRHQDNLGNTAILKPGEIQRMTAGTGIIHSEFNPDAKIPTHMLQIWIMPAKKDQTPSWEQIRWTDLPEFDSGLKLIASPDGRDRSATIGHDATVWHVSHHQDPIDLPLSDGRKAWLQIATGTASIQTAAGTTHLAAGDGLAVSDELHLAINAGPNLSALWFCL